MTKQIEILSTINLDQKFQEKLTKISEKINLTVNPPRQAGEITPEVWEKTEILLTLSTLPDPEKAPNLRWIQSILAGTENITNHPIANQPEIIITSMSGANATQVAEHALTLLLCLSRQIPDLLAKQNRSEWMANRLEGYRPTELRDKVVGIIGYGSIGRQIARLLQPFGVQVLATKRDVFHPEDHNYIPEGQGDPQGNFFTRLYPPEAIKSMLKESDFIVVTVPLTENTKNLIGPGEIAAFKPSAYLIDVSRGGIVDQEALTDALVQNKLAGAALDVFPVEPLPADSLLWQLPNVIITPHLAGVSPHYTERAMVLFAENINRYIDEESLLNRVSPRKGY